MARFGEGAYLEGYEGLVNGIIKQAVIDWVDAMYVLKYEPSNIIAMRTKRDVERFFNSEWYYFMCGIDGKTMSRMVREAFYNNEFTANRKI